MAPSNTVKLLGGWIVKKRYVDRLSAEEREELTSLVETGKQAAYRRRHAQILLRADQGEHGPAEPDHEIAKQEGVWRQTVEKIRKRCVLEGLEPPWSAASAAATAPRCSMGRGRRS